MVVFGAPKHIRSSHRLWEEPKAPDFVLEIASESTHRIDQGQKRDLYAGMGVVEYWQYDPVGDYFEPPLLGFRLVEGRYAPISATADTRRAVSFCAGPRQSPHESSGSGPRPTRGRRGHHTAAPPPAGRAWRRTRLENHHPYTHGAPRNQQSLDQVAAGEIFSITYQSPPVAFRVLRPSLSKRAGLQVRLHVDIQVFRQNSGAESGNASRKHN